MRIFTLILLSCVLFSCIDKVNDAEIMSRSNNPDISSKIQVLNFATFHMGNTTDANTVEFDEENKKNQADAKLIAEMISNFKPTIICVEVPPSSNSELNFEYRKYINTPNTSSSYYGEVGLVAFEVGRLNNVDRLYGIDHKMEYNYNISNELTNDIDSLTYNTFHKNPFGATPELNIMEDNLPLLERLRRINHPKILDLLITANADMLAFVGTKDGFEGADEAAKYYQRNLRIYSNLNRIPLKKEDRVFILSGGSHTAFLSEFMKRSPKYEVVNPFDYLK